MENIIKYLLGIFLLLFSSLIYAWQWNDLWQTPDQQAARLLRAGKAKEAAQTFVNKDWQAVSSYRAQDYAHAFHYFSSKSTSDAQYNAGNAAAYLGHYKAALDAYDKAIALNPNNKDAVFNREIVKKLADKNKNASKQKNEKENKDKDNKESSKNEKNAKKQDSKNKEQNNKSNEKQQDQQTPENQSSSSKNKEEQQANKQNSEQKPQADSSALSERSSAKDEDKKQLLRRLADDPGGLLRQKFLRDYFRRHADEQKPEEG